MPEKKIPNIAYKDFLLNQKEPDRDDANYVPFWLKHIEYCKSGVIVGGIKISGWLYWHLNFFKLTIDKKDEYGNGIMEVLNPDFRDNEYMIEYAFQKTDNDKKKPLMAFGTRRFSKTSFIASRMAYKSYIFSKSHTVLVGASSVDINNITKYFNEYYETRQDCFSDLQKYGDWNKSASDVEIAFNEREVKKGKKAVNPITKHLIGEIQNNKFVFSQIAVRNLEHGQVKSKEEMLAGVTPTEVIWDEALEEDTLIPTPTGFRKIKDIHIGESIFDKNGEVTEVMDKVDVGVKPLYEITLLDGRKVKACGDHIWEVKKRDGGQTVILPTKKIFETYIRDGWDKSRSKNYIEYKYSIPLPDPTQYTKKELPLEPYFIGSWLGDGNKQNTTIYTADQETINYLEDYSRRLGVDFSLKKGNNNINVCSLIKLGQNSNPTKDKMKVLGLIGNKHIPDIYKMSSIEDRVNLLKGLMDTDGTITKTGGTSLSTTTDRLKDDFLELCSSLGVRYKCTASIPTFTTTLGEKKNGVLAYRIYIYPKFNPFNLTRKRDRWIESAKSKNKKKAFYKTHVPISNMKRIGAKQAYCFTVKSPTSTFLCGQYIPTVNCAKYGWEKQHSALLPAIATVYGKRCTEVFCGTGGNIDFSKDAEKAFLTAEEVGFFHFDLNEFKENINTKYFPYTQVSNLEVGLFVPAQMSLEGGEKKKIPLSDYILRDYTEQDLKDLEGFMIEITDWEQATKNIEDYIKEQTKTSDSAGKKAQMYYPFQPEDCFLYSGNNPFPVEEAKLTLQRIKDTGATGENVLFTQDKDGTIHIEPSSKKVIESYPFEGGTHDAPVIIYERPIHDDPTKIRKGVYVAGFDGYKIADSKTTDSVGSFYIYKRMCGLDGLQNQIVLSFATRPSMDSNLYRQVMLAVLKYNADLLPERDTNLYNFLANYQMQHLIVNCQTVVFKYAPNSNANTTYGLPATPQNKEHYLKMIQNYCNETIEIGRDDYDNPITIKGVERITDPMLLEEIIAYGKVKNADRLAAFGHTLVWVNELHTRGVNATQEEYVSPERKETKRPSSKYDSIMKRHNR